MALVRAGPLGKYVENEYHLTSKPFRPLISIVSVGEVLKLTKDFNWGKAKIRKMWDLLRNLVWVDINRREILEAYAGISHASEKSGHPIPQNDYWIAATANATGATLLTTDKDFDHLHGKLLQRIWVDESSGKR